MCLCRTRWLLLPLRPPLDVLPVGPLVRLNVLEAALGIADGIELRTGAAAVGGAAGLLGYGRSLRYWITSSARASTAGGIVRPSALAVLRLITNSNFVGCSMGRSAGFAPLRILST